MNTERGLPLRARLLISGIILGGAAALAARIPELRSWTQDDLLAFGGLVLAIAVIEQFQIPLRHGSETHNFALTDSIWVAALLLTSPSVLVLSVATGVLAGQIFRRWAAVKIAFNVGQFLLAITAAELLYHGLDPPAGSEPEAWLAALIAMSAFFVVNSSAIAGVIAFVQEKPFMSVLLPPLRPNVVHWLGNVAIGIVVVVVWHAEQAALPLLAVPFAMSYVGYRGWFRSMLERERMREMVKTADAISEQKDLAKRILDTGASDDFSRLATTLNRMLDRLERAFLRERLFISEASHELKTPITICRGHLEVLGENPTAEELRKTSMLVIDELGRMGRIVNDMVTLASVEQPGFLQPQPVHLDSFLDQVATKALPLLNGRLEIGDVPADAYVEADPHRLTQALINLLQNAAVHTPRASKVDLGVIRETGGFRFEVSDDGGGLPVGDEESVFQPFRRGDVARPGTGLGLPIVRAVAEAHGGSAGAVNRPGEGVTFWIRLPA